MNKRLVIIVVSIFMSLVLCSMIVPLLNVMFPKQVVFWYAGRSEALELIKNGIVEYRIIKPGTNRERDIEQILKEKGIVCTYIDANGSTDKERTRGFNGAMSDIIYEKYNIDVRNKK